MIDSKNQVQRRSVINFIHHFVENRKTKYVEVVRSLLLKKYYWKDFSCDDISILSQNLYAKLWQSKGKTVFSEQNIQPCSNDGFDPGAVSSWILKSCISRLIPGRA